MTDGELRIDVPLEEVREALATYVKDEGYIEPWAAANALAPVLRFDRSVVGREAVRGWNRLRRQVTAELNKMAVRGELVKVGPRELTPRGQRLAGNECRFYTRERYEADSKRAAEFAGEQAAAREHREAIRARLRALVIPPAITGGDRIYLDDEHWDILLDLAEAGDRCIRLGQS